MVTEVEMQDEVQIIPISAMKPTRRQPSPTAMAPVLALAPGSYRIEAVV